MLYPPADPTTLAAMRVLQDRQRKPIVVSNPNDPRLRAYQDSLALHEYQKYEIGKWNELVKMTPAQRNAFYEKDYIERATDPNRVRDNQFKARYRLNIPENQLEMKGTNQYIDSPGIRHHKPLPFPAPQQPVVLNQEKRDYGNNSANWKTVAKRPGFHLQENLVQVRNNGNLRPDGTPKGKGFFGEIKRPDGKVSTELSIGVNIGGKEVLIPTMVPTLTKSEVAYLLSGKYNPSARQGVDDVISRKAIDFARQRQAEKKPFFATPQEEGKFQPAPTPVPQSIAPMQPSTNVAPAVPEQTLRTMPIPQPEPSKSDTLWGPGQRYSIKDEKVRSMLKAIQRLKK
jgi:hypothetical protein